MNRALVERVQQSGAAARTWRYAALGQKGTGSRRETRMISIQLWRGVRPISPVTRGECRRRLRIQVPKQLGEERRER
jgi:hypothetical protein